MQHRWLSSHEFGSGPCRTYIPREVYDSLEPGVRLGYHALGLVGTALSKKISVFQSGSLKVVPIRPNAP